MRNFAKKFFIFSLTIGLLFQLVVPAYASTDLSEDKSIESEIINNEQGQVTEELLSDTSNNQAIQSEIEVSDSSADSEVEIENDEQAQEQANGIDEESSTTEEDSNVEEFITEKSVGEKNTDVVKEDTTNNSETDIEIKEATEEKEEMVTFSTQVSYRGIALQSPTHVYKEASTSNGIWKSYEQGSILQYRSYSGSNDWYEATVIVDGQKKTGYIHKSHVENVDTSKQTNYKGIALKNATKVFQKASTSSKEWKSYDQGSILQYRSFSKNWYEATVIVKGKKRTGYIHKSHVESIDTSNQVNYKGIALQNPTKVFQKASTSSKTLKAYDKGRILQYRSFSKDWYEATVIVKGKKRTGYIHKSHVENGQTSNQEDYRGVALKEPTRVYKHASTSLGAWKTYSQGSILKYRSFSKNWYEATVIVRGKERTGYILKSDVENAVSNQIDLKGIALKDKTPIYQRASTSSNVLKDNYKAGQVLKYKSFTSNWYEATVYIKGKQRTGYIHKSHVDELVNNSGENLQVIAKDRVNAYAGPSRNSKILKPYAKFSILKVKTLSKNWYEATVYVDGKRNRAFFNVNDVSADHVITNKYYDITFEEFVDLQMNQSTPKSDGAGKIPATREEVEKYANPANFKAGTPEYFQFLVLTSFAGLSVKDLNNYLSDKGSLQGQGQAFIDAAKKHGINEVYLLSHALHETGNGTSTLANGIPVDIEGNVIRDSNGKIDYNKNHPNYHTTVYNFFGYGAHDDDAINDGAKYAFEQGWTSKYDAIVGGAASIGNNYVKKGQDTLYKMRWNVDQAVNDGAVWKQYANHVAWATIQTKNIFNIYNSLTNYILAFEVPVFKKGK